MHRTHGLTSVYVTHNLSFASRCDRVLKLEGGALAPCLLEDGKAYV
jgi:lipoprotein-releasing system ATP-binding protein